jgi:hypothetical protein
MTEIMEPGRGKVEIADVFAAYAEACEAIMAVGNYFSRMPTVSLWMTGPRRY